MLRIDVDLNEISDSTQLLKQYKHLLDKIYHNSQVPNIYFENYYLYTIKKLALWVQDLPASQAHHHNQKGGFLLHTLEVINLALEKRYTKMLPAGVSAEKQNDKKDVWTFAIFITALLHDIGKTINDVHIILYDIHKKKIGRWSPWFGDMTQIKKANYYSYKYNTERKYFQHELLPLTVMSKFVNPYALDWLQQDSSLFYFVLLTLQGRHVEGGVIADIIKYADSKSSADSLPYNQTPSLQQTRKSLPDKLLQTIRYILLETDIKINVPGAFVYTTDTDIFLVSKKIIDLIRDTLTKHNQTGMPYHNTRVMDELTQHQLIITNKENKAIWNISLSGGGFKKPVTLTMLRVSIDKIFDNDNAPQKFNGTIDILEESIDPTPITETTQTQSIETASEDLPLPPLGHESDPIPTTSETSTPKVDAKVNEEDVKEANCGKDFLEWLINSINKNTIYINKPNAKVHIVTFKGARAIFLVSPKIFKEYNIDHWSKIQRKFTNLKINLKTSTNENIWKVQTKTERKNKSGAIIKGYLITNLKELKLDLDKLPNSNKYICLIQQ